MADRTTYTLTVPTAGLTPDTIEQITDCLDADDIETRPTYLSAYVEERRCGETRDIAEEIARILDQAGAARPFEVWEAPKYEWLGTLARHAPGRDLFVCDCDAEGTPTVSPAAITSICQETTATAMRARLLAAIGTTHAAALAQALDA